MASQHVLAIGKIVAGEVTMDVALPPLWAIEELPVDGELQRLIDEAADDYESWLDDVDFFRHGC